ncbi:MAG TPA: protease pro-enzyme activation domain-containing protein [Opitutaceae bacterium]|nr:protease pro-enzyme activation domain-containing protein [Opitutaceae bacterium]
MKAQESRPARILFGKSIKEVPENVQGAPTNPHRANIARKTLNKSETDATMGFEVALKIRNFAELQSRVSHGELIPRSEMDAKYHPLDSDYKKVANWLTSQGLTITHRDPSHLVIFASGKVSDLAQCFQITFARVTAENSEFTSAITAPSVPGDIAALILGINGLQPHIRPHHHLVSLKELPLSTTSFAPPYLPSQIAHAYNADTVSVTGAGQTVAIVIDAFPATSDLSLFWSSAGVNQSLGDIVFVPVGSGPISSPPLVSLQEATLDVEWSSGIASGTKVRVYGVNTLSFQDLDQAYLQIFNDLPSQPGLQQVSLSFALGEDDTPTDELSTDDGLFAELASAGVTVFAGSGDNGSNPDDNGGSNGPLQPEFPADDPNVMGVGGTSLVLNSNTGNVVSETVWNSNGGSSGGGVSGAFLRPDWQIGAGVPAGTTRCVPDIASSADPNNGGFFVFRGRQNGEVGGTSLATPIWAGFCALINQARANAGLPSLGLLGPKIYPLIGTNNFRDITSGSNGAFSAGPGYDLVTGLGTPNVAALLQSLILIITTQPVTQTVNVGASASFSVSASGSPAFQWFFNGAAISGATSTTLTLTNVQLPNAGNYTVTATTNAGSVTSNPAALTVQQPVTTGHSVSILAGAGSSFQWQVSTDGGSTWTNLTDNGTFSGTTTSTLTIANATAALNGDEFRVAGGGAVTLTVAPALFPSPTCIVADSSGNLFVGDGSSNTIQEINSSAVVSLLAGSTGSAGATDGNGGGALFRQPGGITMNSTGTLFVADTGNSTIRKIAPGGIVTTFAGSAGNQSFRDGAGTGAFFNMPVGISLDASGNLFVADANNEVIRKITAGGTVITFAGTAGAAGSTDLPAHFNFPSGLAVDNSSGNLYIGDTNNDTIRRITPAGVVTTLAGTEGVTGTANGNGLSMALFNSPSGVATDSTGNIYVADTGNSTIRKITPGGTVTTLAGLGGIAGLLDGTGLNALFNHPKDLTVDSAGNVYVADTGNAAIRKITPAGAVTTLTLSVAPPPQPAAASTPAPASSGGGGGGAFDGWFLGFLALAGILRWRLRKS